MLWCPVLGLLLLVASDGFALFGPEVNLLAASAERPQGTLTQPRLLSGVGIRAQRVRKECEESIKSVHIHVVRVLVILEEKISLS